MIKPITQVSTDPSPNLLEATIAGIRTMIREEGLHAGDALPSEAALAQRHGVSRTVVREALRSLAALKVVELANGRRARVGAPDAQALSAQLEHTVQIGRISILQVLDVRRALERRTAMLAAMRRSDAQAAEMLHVVALMEEAVESAAPDAVETVMEQDIALHELIAAAGGNALFSILVQSYAVITRQTWGIGWHARGTQQERRRNIALHRRLAEAIAARDAAGAEALMEEHFDNAAATLMKAGIT